MKRSLFPLLESRLADIFLYGTVLVMMVFFYVPIITLIGFSFHDGRYLVLPSEGFSLRWYGELWENHEIRAALWNSFWIASVTMVVATAIGTMTALVVVRYKFSGLRIVQIIAAAPLAFPQLLLGIILLLWFSVLGRWLDFGTGIGTALVGHIVYVAPFAMIVSAVQVHAFDMTLEDAARDCGASNWMTYRYVTLPLIWPGVLSAAIFAFLLSWGNFYLSYSLAGTVRTLPTFVFSGIAIGSTPLYPAIATVAFVPSLVLVAIFWRLRTRMAKTQS